MSWDCCSPSGECKGGHGCPAGVVLHQGTERNLLPGVARIGKQQPRPDALRRVQLDAGQAKPTKHLPGLLRRVVQLVAAAAVVGIWVLATAATDAQPSCTSGQGQCTSWEAQA